MPLPVGATLEISELVKRYGETLAVDHLSLSIPPGSIYGLLGPNGAGKTTTLEIIEGLRTADSGRVTYGGTDVLGRHSVTKLKFGVQLQATSFFELLTVEETLVLFSSLYPRAVPVDELIERHGLTDKRRSRVGGLSGGQRQRLALAAALVHDPEVVFLDEPSAGLDPQARRHLWETILGLKQEGRTVVLTTHYMEEAETLCDTLAIVDHGRVLAQGAPQRLIAQHVPEAHIALSWPAGADWDSLNLPHLTHARLHEGKLELSTDQLESTLVALVQEAKVHGLPLQDLNTRTATLEDLFLQLTGRSLRE